MIDTATEADMRAIADSLDGRAMPALCKQTPCGAPVLVYRLQNVARGYLLWRWVAPRGVARIDRIFVEPNFRRHGMARRLIARFEGEIARSGGQGWVAEADPARPSGLALMRRVGAKGSGHRFEKRLHTPQASSSPATIPR